MQVLFLTEVFLARCFLAPGVPLSLEKENLGQKPVEGACCLFYNKEGDLACF